MHDLCVKEYEIKRKNGTWAMTTTKTAVFIGLWLENYYLVQGGGGGKKKEKKLKKKKLE